MAQSIVNLDEELEYLVSDLKTEISQSTALKVNIFFPQTKENSYLINFFPIQPNLHLPLQSHVYIQILEQPAANDFRFR